MLLKIAHWETCFEQIQNPAMKWRGSYIDSFGFKVHTKIVYMHTHCVHIHTNYVSICIYCYVCMHCVYKYIHTPKFKEN